MSRLCLVENGGYYDVHAGQIIDYSPIIYIENENYLQIDNDIKLSCAEWQCPYDYMELRKRFRNPIKLNKNCKYLIYDINSSKYGYILDENEHIFDEILINNIGCKLKDLAFEHCILHG
jgi:hypothetical protein